MNKVLLNESEYELMKLNLELLQVKLDQAKSDNKILRAQLELYQIGAELLKLHVSTGLK